MEVHGWLLEVRGPFQLVRGDYVHFLEVRASARVLPSMHGQSDELG